MDTQAPLPHINGMRYLAAAIGFACIAGCTPTPKPDAMFVLNKDATSIDLVQVRGNRGPLISTQDLQGLAEIHCVGPATLTGTRKLDASRGGHTVFKYQCE